MKTAAIGVDIGGTGVKLALVSSSGRVLTRDTFATRDHAGREALLAELSRRIRGLADEGRRRGMRIAGAGVGAPGPIDVERGFVYFFPNIPGWKNAPIRSLLERRTGLPVRVDNDANAMALGESIFGAGRGARNLIALTLGTGIGGGIVMDGRLFHGPAYSAAEIGHIVINENGPKCGCGNRGCIETYVGNGHFVRAVRERLARGEKSVLSRWVREGRELTPLLVARAADRGDRLAVDQWRITATRLGTVLAGLVNVLNPERIVLGGGIALNRKHIFPVVTQVLREKAFPIAARSVRVVPAALGTDAGTVGAAALVFASVPRSGKTGRRDS